MCLPKKVLDLFPMWEHRCPCGVFVEPTVTCCPHCNLPFDADKWQVPPRFLNNRKAMSDYAHNVLAPKLNPVQRASLFKHFTRIFSNGFEEGNFSAYDSTEITAGETLAVQQVYVHHGLYAARATTNGSTNYEHARCKKLLAPTLAEVYARSYNKVISHNLSVLNDKIFFLAFEPAVLMCGWRHDGTDIHWALYMRNGVGNVDVFGLNTPTPVTGKWFCVEGYWLKDAVNGIGRVWADGALVVEKLAQNTSALGNCVAVQFVANNIYRLKTINMVTDCCVIADAYIGTEPPLTQIV